MFSVMPPMGAASSTFVPSKRWKSIDGVWTRDDGITLREEWRRGAFVTSIHAPSGRALISGRQMARFPTYAAAMEWVDKHRPRFKPGARSISRPPLAAPPVDYNFLTPPLGRIPQ